MQLNQNVGDGFHNVPQNKPQFFRADDILPYELMFKATPHKARLTALHEICVHISRHLAQKLLEMRQHSCVISIQSDEKSDCTSSTQALCGIALNFLSYAIADCRVVQRGTAGAKRQVVQKKEKRVKWGV